MKAWSFNGIFRNNATSNEYIRKYVVLTEEGQDPIATCIDMLDMSGITYLRGSVVELKAPAIISHEKSY